MSNTKINISEETKKAIQADYESITDFRNNGLDKLAAKYGISISELRDIIHI